MHPVLFQFHSFTIYSYGFFIAVAMLAAMFMAGRRSVLLGIPSSAVYDLIFLLFVSGIIGARLFYVLQHWPDYRSDLLRAFLIREGGLVWYGGFLLGAFAGIGYAIVKKLPVLSLCDFFSPLAALGHAIGRVGCFFNGCCYGRITSPRWGVVFDDDRWPRLPVQLYEAALLTVLFFVLDRMLFKKHRPGEVFVAYLFSYGLIRFFTEFLRGDQTPIAGLTIPQWTSLILILGAALLATALRRARPR